MKEEFDALDDTVCNSGVLEPVDLLNRPNSFTKPNMLLEAIRLFQRKDGETGGDEDCARSDSRLGRRAWRQQMEPGKNAASW